MREEREMLLTEIDEAKDFITNLISSIEIEQQKREELFDEFKVNCFNRKSFLIGKIYNKKH